MRYSTCKFSEVAAELKTARDQDQKFDTDSKASFKWFAKLRSFFYSTSKLVPRIDALLTELQTLATALDKSYSNDVVDNEYSDAFDKAVMPSGI